MKKRDIGVIIAVALIAGLVSLIISKFIFSANKNYNLKTPKIEPISAEFTVPSDRYFNNDSINPTVDIQIGNNSNPGALGD